MSMLDKVRKFITPSAPWEKYYTKEELKIKVPDKSLYQFMKDCTKEHKNRIAYTYFGKTTTYQTFLKQIDTCSKAFVHQGIKPGDVVTICMPNTPEGIICFYALNKIGAIANMIHPLSAEEEIKNYLISTNSVMLVMIDLCYEKIKNIINQTNVYKTVVVSAKDSMPVVTKVGYMLTQGYKVKKPRRYKRDYIYYKDFILRASMDKKVDEAISKKDTPAVILHSGGTTGNPKGILLSNGNFNAMAIQSFHVFKRIKPGDKVLTIMPIFHGFGLSVSCHIPYCFGANTVLIPQFNAKKFDRLLEQHHPNILLGVPTLYEAMIHSDRESLDLSCLKYVVSGGDTLSLSLTRKINIFLKEHGCETEIGQGYGMTESLAATALAFDEANKEGSIGIPFPGNYFKIVLPGTQDELAPCEDGEICISGPTIMLGYLDNEKETNEILQKHKDGRIWLHTGDIGCIDSDGVLFYKQRLKRMIVSSGYNVYPKYIEEVIEEHEAVLNCTVIGIPHPYKVEVPKAYIVLKNGYKDSFTVKRSIKEHCKKNLARYSVPYEYEFRESLPKTLIGKVDFNALREESIRKMTDEK